MTGEERERELERVDALMPEQPENREEVLRILEERGLIGGHRIVFRTEWAEGADGKRELMMRCRCSVCGWSWLAERQKAVAQCRRGAARSGYWSDTYQETVYSGDTALCPRCGDTNTKALHVGDFGGPERRIDDINFMTVENVGGHLALLEWRAERLVDKNALESTVIHPYEACVVVGGACYRYNGDNSLFYYRSWHRWERRVRYVDNTTVWSAKQLMPFDGAVVAATDAEKSGFEDYVRGNRNSANLLPVSYLHLWCKRPAVENLARYGMARYVAGMMAAAMTNKWSGCQMLKRFDWRETARFCDWTKVKPHELLRMEKDEYRRLAGRSFDAINLYIQLKDVYGARLDQELLELAERAGYSALRALLTEREKYGARVSPARAIRYCAARKEEDKAFKPGDLLDHWRMVSSYYGRLPPELMYPKRFAEAHTRFAALLADAEKDKWDADIAARAAGFRRLAWEDGELGLLIRPAGSAGELKREGEKLRHCVAGYAERVARGETMLFFIRRTEAPDEPFFTLEYKNGAVIQNRGYKNRDRTPEVTEFEQRWLAHVCELLKEEKKEAKKRGRNDSNRRSAAA